MVTVFETGTTAISYLLSFAIQTDVTLAFLPKVTSSIKQLKLHVKFSNQTHVPFKVQLS